MLKFLVKTSMALQSTFMRSHCFYLIKIIDVIDFIEIGDLKKLINQAIIKT